MSPVILQLSALFTNGFRTKFELAPKRPRLAAIAAEVEPTPKSRRSFDRVSFDRSGRGAAISNRGGIERCRGTYECSGFLLKLVADVKQNR